MAILIGFLNSHQKQHLFGLSRFRGNQEGRNDASLDVQDVFRLLLLRVEYHSFPFRHGQPEFVPVPDRGWSQECPFSIGSLFAEAG